MVPYFPPDRIGGVGEVAAHVHRGLLSSGHDSEVVTSGSSREDPTVLRIGRGPTQFTWLSALARLRTSEYDVIHTHHGEGLALLARSRLARPAPPILLTMHVSNRRIGDAHRPYLINGRRFGGDRRAWMQRNVKSRVKSGLDRAAIRLAAEMTFISKSAAADTLGPTSDATVIYNGLPASEESVAGADPVELLYVGTSGLRKRTDLLPLILSEVREAFPDARLRIVGFDLDSHPGLRGHFARFGLMDAVVCEGALASAEIERFYRSARVLVVPSAYEGLPMVIMEAMRAGLPCVATAVGGNAEIIEHGVNGFLTEPDNPDAIAKYCIELLGDPPHAERMGQAGRALLTETFVLQRQVEGYVSVYERLLVGAPRA